MQGTVLSRSRQLYKWVSKDNKVIADGFTSIKKAMDWLKANNLRGTGCTLYAYNKKYKINVKR
jgi:hypothetical protein